MATSIRTSWVNVSVYGHLRPYKLGTQKHPTFFNIIQLLHLNEINMRFYGAEYNNIERGELKSYEISESGVKHQK
jgi:hypothetical protein